jgi:peptidoglycan L-alanyl-D-glutamate endopeptidase CwlK
MAFALSARSRKRLHGVHPDLKSVVERAIEITTVDFGVTCGVRTPAEQRELYAYGRTKPGPKRTNTLRSKHLVNPATGFGHAVDLVPYLHGDVEWDDDGKLGLWDDIADAMKSAARELKVAIRWGGDWDGDGISGERGEWDRPHFELVRR